MIKRFYLEITNSCNLNCSFCEAAKNNEYMTLDDIKKCIIQIKSITDYIYLHILGEPTLHPDFNEILNFCDREKMNVQLVSNGTLLYKYPDILKHQSLRKISISIHSIDDMDINTNYFKTINHLLDDILKYDDKYLELRFYNFINLKNNAKNYHDYLINKYHKTTTKKNNSYYLNKNTYIFYQDLFHWPNINDPFISEKGTCLGAKNMLGILVNGDVVICCLDAEGHTKIGNIHLDSLESIINSERYQIILSDINKGRLTLPLCQKCTYRLRFDK